MTAAALLAGLALYPVSALHHLGLSDIQASPALAVCTVEQVVKLGPVPPHLSRSSWPQHYYQARVLVHRVFFNTADRPFEPGDRIAVRYRDLWGAAAYGQNKPELRLAAILIDDRRQGFGALRYCDVAANVVQMLSGEKFGIVRFEQMSPADRDRFVARAAAWLDSHAQPPEIGRQ